MGSKKLSHIWPWSSADVRTDSPKNLCFSLLWVTIPKLQEEIKAFGDSNNLQEEEWGTSCPNEDQIQFQNALPNVCELIN